jgi:hypothetical protein
MLLPSNRLTLIDAMRPPAGFGLESAMAVTFTLNLSALLAAPAAFAIAGMRDTTANAGGRTPVELIHALRAHAHKFTVFSEAGEIGLPQPSRAFAFLERSVVPVRAPRGGIVHPKVWVLRYQASAGLDGVSEGDRRLRVLISSRNLTFDQSWDTVLRLDETLNYRGASLENVGELFIRLLNSTVGKVETEHQDRVESLAKALQTARFELPEGVDDLSIHVLGFDPAPTPLLPKNAERSLIISPFLTDDFFGRMHPSPVDMLVSRQEALDGLQEVIRHTIPGKYVFDDGSPFEYADPADGHTPAGDDKGPGGAAAPTPSPADPGRPLVGIHAKVYAFEAGDRAYLFVGSANATGAAFRNNVEILAELRGPVSELGIDRLCNGDGDNPGLADLLHVYRRSPEPDPPDESVAVLDRVRREIAGQVIEGIVEQTGESGQEWAVTYRGDQPLPSPDGIEIHCWPLTTPGNRRQVETTVPLQACFETTLEALSGFLAFELTHCGEQIRFVVPVALVGVPEHRGRILLRALIGNAERFLRYLLALLYDDSSHLGLQEVTRIIDGTQKGYGPISLAVLEELLRTMRRDRRKLCGLHPLVADLRSDDALPPGFAELWDAFYEVAIQGAAQEPRLS